PRSVGPPHPAITGSAEQSLIAHNGSGGRNIKSYSVTSKSWPCEYFKPTFPAATTSWKITKLKLMLARNGSAIGNITVQIRTVDSNHLPTSTVLASTIVNVALLSTTAGYVDVAFSGLTS